MKNMFAMINAEVQKGKKKIFVVGYPENNGCTFTECDTFQDAICVKQQMIAEGHKPFIDVYTR